MLEWSSQAVGYPAKIGILTKAESRPDGLLANHSFEWLFTTARQKDYLAGICWWLLYDAKDSPNVPWDLKAGFGLFDSAGHPKEAWSKWTEAYAGN
jgi:hypothetical protein